MTCGEAQNAWVPSVGVSQWSGTAGEASVTAAFTTVLGIKVAAVVVDLVPGVGTWTKDAGGFHVNVALEGFEWQFHLTAEACNEAGDVTACVGTALDGNEVSHQVAMSRGL